MSAEPTPEFTAAPLVAALAARAEAADADTAWPTASWQALRDAGVLAWGVPREYGGRDAPRGELLAGYERLAAGCLTTAFLLSQREAAVRLLAAHRDRAAAAALLTRLAAGEPFVTVGLSQLTTSRRHRAPSVVARPADGGYRVEGEVPWVTGADRAEAVVTGAALDDGRQLLLVLPTGRDGVSVGPPMHLAAVAGSRTAAVRLDAVHVEPALILAGPGEQLLGPVGGGGLDTSALALGLARAAIEMVEAEAGVRPDLRPAAERFRSAHGEARQRLIDLAAHSTPGDAALGLRVDASRLALRATQAALAAAKGTGFVVPHPAGRWARQALFFLVWSCPAPVGAALIAGLTPGAAPPG